MEYSDFIILLEKKNIELKAISKQVKMTPNGLREGIKNETLPIKKIKLICQILGISPLFFYGSEFQFLTTNEKSKREFDLEKEVEYLKSQLRDKNEIINLLREKNNIYGSVAAEPKPYELTKK